MTEPTTTIEDRIRQEAADREATLRANRIAGLRALATLLEENPSLELPTGITTFNVSLVSYSTATPEKEAAIKDSLAAAAKTLAKAGLKVEKEYTDSFLTVSAELAPDVTYEVYADREVVCTKKVVGTKTVLKPIMSEPMHQYQTGTEEVEEEIVEWECEPLLGTVKASAPEEVED